jgi:hypothetical protein
LMPNFSLWCMSPNFRVDSVHVLQLPL